MSDFAEAWSARYGDTPPVGWRLREQYGGRAGSRWFRIHSLPGSKRYPDTPEELAEIHRRHEALAAELFAYGDGACWVVVPDWEEPTVAQRRLDELPDLELTVGWRPLEREAEDDPVVAWVAPARWSAAGTRAARELVIQDRLRVLWVARETLEVFAPYDGGVDIIAGDFARRDDLARRFAAWRSPRSDGL